MSPIYLDYNASTPIAPEVLEAMLPYLTSHFGNASSAHAYGQQGRQAIMNARAQVAALLNCEPDEVIFTSGGSEANNFAIKGYLDAHPDAGNEIITPAIEHPATSEACKYMERVRGYRVFFAPVDELGRVQLEALQQAISARTALISVMHANNEVGTIQPVREITALAHAHNIAVHCDAAQSAGKVPVNMKQMEVDMLSVAGHKLYAPLGVGALIVRRGLQLERLIHGAKQEQQRRAGTENVAGIVGLGKACDIAARDLEKNMTHMKMLRGRLRTSLSKQIEEIRFNGHAEDGLPNTLSVSFRGVQANALLAEISHEIAASAGAACHSSGEIAVSHVLQAMNVPRDYVMGTLRLSVGKFTTEEEIDRAVKVIAQGVGKLQHE